MQIYQENLSQLFKTFVKNADVRSDVLRWIGDCLRENRGKCMTRNKPAIDWSFRQKQGMVCS